MKKKKPEPMQVFTTIQAAENEFLKKYAAEPMPLRSELLTTEQLHMYCIGLANRHPIVDEGSPADYLQRLLANESALQDVRDLLTTFAGQGCTILPAADWLLDNYYLIDAHLRSSKAHLEKDPLNELPLIELSPGTVDLRVNAIIREVLLHSDGRLNQEILTGAVAAYQQVSCLQVNELRATPVVLIVLLLENLRRIAVRIALATILENRRERSEENSKNNRETDPVMNSLEISLAEQVCDKVSLRNNMSSLRMAGTGSWREYIQSSSIVQKILAEDPAGVFAAMEYNARDSYSKVVESLALQSKLPEQTVARLTVQLAKKATAGKNNCVDHVGYYLQGEGLKQIKNAAAVNDTVVVKVKAIIKKMRLGFYLSSIAGMTVLCTAALLLPGIIAGTPAWLVAIAGFCLLVAASQLAVTFTNWLSTVLVKPTLLPRLDYSEGIPAESRTLAIVPGMLGSEAEVEALTVALEIRYLAANDPHLHFGLLTDFKDAASEVLPGDDELLALAREKIESLNKKYGSATNDIFFLFHRPRKWNAQQGVWMGYERKRGKLTQLNELLLNGADEPFSCMVGNRELFPQLKYIITLDADTQLPREAAWKLVATMAHPLNKPVYDEGKGRITKGYGILQPRIGAYIPEVNRSLYVRMQGNVDGIDPYTRATSDVYQDLFGEGSFIGKGIYDIKVFNGVMKNKFPENLVLSHDLIEGCYMRSGLVSDVQLFEERPFGYYPDTRRHHRWIRGDWQIASYLFPFVRLQNGARVSNKLSVLSRWKIFDNLRRSIIPFVLLLLLVAGWTQFHNPLYWTLLVTGFILFPCLLSFVHAVLTKPSKIISWKHWWDFAKNSVHSFMQSVFAMICLPYEAYYTTGAITRSLWRMLVSKKHLLEWNHSGSTVHNQVRTLADTYRLMWICPSLSVAVFLYLYYFAPASLSVALPYLLAWLPAPVVTWLVSLQAKPDTVNITPSQTKYLRKLSRKIWSFFEEFVNANDHWLPPDYYQEYPVKRVSHRTSPTNMGLLLLANLSAHDFGYSTTGEFLYRTANALHTMQALEKFRGHFYNWYDTHTLQPVKPLYISTVDSGNLVGHLLVLRQGLLALPGQPVINNNLFKGLQDTIDNLPDDWKNREQVKLIGDELDRLIAIPALSQPIVKRGLNKLQELISQLRTGNVPDDSGWLLRLEKQCKEYSHELLRLLPWQTLETIPGKYSPLPEVNTIPTVKELAEWDAVLTPTIDALLTAAETDADKQWLQQWKTAISKASAAARERIAHIDRLVIQCENFAEANFGFLYNQQQQLLSIGYNVEKQSRDTGCYDLLASEARLATYIGIAKGTLPLESWFALGRPLAELHGSYHLLSWSGSMFEYLMPMLVMPAYKNSLLELTNKSVVQQQVRYGQERNVPWGISECAYNEIDINMSYQYGPSGVPGTGLQRGLQENLVIAPYATLLALVVDPQQACENLQRLSALGAEGKFGFLEAVDFTAARLPNGKQYELVKSCMLHHQGMGMLALTHVLLNKPMQKRFKADLHLKTGLVLLLEQMNKDTAFPVQATTTTKHTTIDTGNKEMKPVTVEYKATDLQAHPNVQLLSNGKYHVMLSNAGTGYSRWNDLALTRWREDSTCDNRGLFCYIKDVDSGFMLSGTYQPVCKPVKEYNINFSQGVAGFRQHADEWLMETTVAVSQEEDMEVRRLTLTNQSTQRKTVAVTSFAEVVITPPDDDAWHPAFSNLFVETAIDETLQTIICKRRSRSVQKQVPYLFHSMKVHGCNTPLISYETDRLQFIGRNKTNKDPQAIQKGQALSGSKGSVLDPVVAIQCQVVIEPGETMVADMLLGIGETGDNCLAIAEKYQQKKYTDSIFQLASKHHKAVLKKIKATEKEAQLFGQLAGYILYPDASWRADEKTIAANRLTHAALYNYGINGKQPVYVFRITEAANLEMVEQLVKAHACWRLYGLPTDLIIWNEGRDTNRQFLHSYIMETVAMYGNDSSAQPGSIYVLDAARLPEEDKALMLSVARMVIRDEEGSLAEQLAKRSKKENAWPLHKATLPVKNETAAQLPLPSLQFYNGIGGFSQNGKEYISSVGAGVTTPMPWSNIIANPSFGTVLSESGQCYTWFENAHACRLTPWHNDPVADSAGEAFYLRDEEDGYYWSPAPLPAGGQSNYITRHGFGYSIFEHREHGIHSNMKIYVDTKDAIKIAELKIHNYTTSKRHLTITGYVEWVLDNLRSKSAMHIVTRWDEKSNVLLAVNPFNAELAEQVSFLTVNSTVAGFTANRLEFIGRNGSLQQPQAMQLASLSGQAGAAMDPCAAIQVPLELEPDQEVTIVFLLGAGKDKQAADRLVKKYRQPDAAEQSFHRVQQYWQQTLGAIRVKTPDASLNILANGWLLYQAITCRLWARSGYYQSGGAYGFRDQLQDVMAVLYTEPQLAREQLLRCAARQFREGDVQHWWHPPAGKGVRTKCSDDYLWLPYVLCRYITITGDIDILDEAVPFLEGGVLGPGEESCYAFFPTSATTSSLYDHCIRAIQHGLRYGIHGLPLMGSGDWNDGLDKVGIEGKGESVWVGFLFYSVLNKFAELATAYGDNAFAAYCKTKAGELTMHMEEHGWDGAWYRRAYYDDGTPLGSAMNEECSIDSMSQSWAVLSGMAGRKRAESSMDAVYRRLVCKDAALIKLFDPPFNKAAKNPGYIKGYLPGIRENGGQYTHAAIWTVMAFARMGNNQRVWELFKLINPVMNTNSPDKINVYKVEPYVMAADVYTAKGHTGRGGWTWYTGSAGWMYQLVLESILGFTKEAGQLKFSPCMPGDWKSVYIKYQYGQSTYHITLLNEKTPGKRIFFDDVPVNGQSAQLVDDGYEHFLTVYSASSAAKQKQAAGVPGS